MLLYLFLRFLTRIGLAIFFRKKIINHQHLLPTEGPLILAVNHPNTLMDVLLVAAHTKQRVGFLANASLFDNAFAGKLLTYLNAIPVYRKQDLKEGETMDNRSSFRKCVEYLENGGTLMVFPEGSSYSEMKLRKLKTGLARIALEFAEKNDFQKELSIVPIGLNYSDPLYFRSNVIVNIGAPLSIKSYHEIHQKNHAKAVHAINEDLRKRFEKQLILLADKPQEGLFKDLLTIFSSPRDFSSFENQYKLASTLKNLQYDTEDAYQQVESLNSAYHQERKKLKLAHTGNAKPFFQLIFEIIGFLLGLPFFLIGFIIHIVPALLSKTLPPKATKEIEYWAALKLIVGIFLYPIWYAMLMIGVYFGLSLSIWQSLALLLTLPFMGIFTIFYTEKFQELKNSLRLFVLSQRNSARLKQLEELKIKLLKLGMRAFDV